MVVSWSGWFGPPGGGPPTARQLTYNNVIVETHQHCQPVKFTADGKRVAITLPDAVARMLLDLGEWGLPPLAGVTTAPLLAADGSILVRAGYDRAHAMWCEPVPDLTVPIRADARRGGGRAPAPSHRLPHVSILRITHGDVR